MWLIAFMATEPSYCCVLVYLQCDLAPPLIKDGVSFSAQRLAQPRDLLWQVGH